MIRFALHCDQAHEFDVWFRSNNDYEIQYKKQLINCPICGSTAIEKTLMAPSVSTTRKCEQVVTGDEQAKTRIRKQLQQLAKSVRENADYVGEQFAEEARKIHFGEVNPRTIYGEANKQEIASLLQDGIDVLPLPALPEKQN